MDKNMKKTMTPRQILCEKQKAVVRSRINEYNFSLLNINANEIINKRRKIKRTLSTSSSTSL